MHANSRNYTDAGSEFDWDWEQALDLLQAVADRARRTSGARNTELLAAIDTHCTVLRRMAAERESDSSLDWLETLHGAATSINTLATAAAVVSPHPHNTLGLGQARLG